MFQDRTLVNFLKLTAAGQPFPRWNLADTLIAQRCDTTERSGRRFIRPDGRLGCRADFSNGRQRVSSAMNFSARTDTHPPFSAASWRD